MASKSKANFKGRIIDFPGVARSKVWQYFGFPNYEGSPQPDKTKTICKTCFTVVPCSKGTSGMLAHIGRAHWTPGSKQPKITETVEKQKKWPINSPDATKITKAIAEFIILDLQVNNWM